MNQKNVILAPNFFPDFCSLGIYDNLNYKLPLENSSNFFWYIHEIKENWNKGLYLSP